MKTVRVAVDIGGTFTDLVGMDDQGFLSHVKVLSTPSHPESGFVRALDQMFKEWKIRPREVSLVVHATTLASNALLTGELPKVCLVTTKGFRDVLEIGRQNRPELYNLQVERPRPLVPRRLRLEVDERTAYDGKIIKPLDFQESVRVANLVRNTRSQSVAISLLHSYANKKHERLLARQVSKQCPRLWMTLSSSLLPEFREYERTSTTVVNACLQPVISEYLHSLDKQFRLRGVRAPFFMMQSNGGTISSKQSMEEPARVIESGPVAGAVAAKYFGRLAKEREIISFDVGGTTSKAGVWVEKRFELTTDYEVGGRMHGTRRLEGSGYPVKLPLVDLVEVGTGGGSIARVDTEGVLHVGPESAGANPGPACYGLGGEEATLTDAHMVLGRLNPDSILGGSLKVHPTQAERVIYRKITKKLGGNRDESALAILRIAVDNMTSVLRAASVERGKDPRGMLLVAFGGAGPMHACEVAQELGVTKILVPANAGLFSSLGLLIADPSRDYVRTMMTKLEESVPRMINQVFNEMVTNGRNSLETQGIRGKSVITNRFIDLRYAGQGFELSIPVSTDAQITESSLEAIRRRFHKTHFELYGYSDERGDVELVNLRATCVGRRPPPKLGIPSSRKQARPPIHKDRDVTFLSGKVRKCPIYQRNSLPTGLRGRGPAILEDYDSTVILPPRTRYTIDPLGGTRIVFS